MSVARQHLAIQQRNVLDFSTLMNHDNETSVYSIYMISMIRVIVRTTDMNAQTFQQGRSSIGGRRVSNATKNSGKIDLFNYSCNLTITSLSMNYTPSHKIKISATIFLLFKSTIHPPTRFYRAGYLPS